LPALTEAYYRNLPIIALTSQQATSDFGDFKPQYVNRAVTPLDVKRISVNLPVIKDVEDEKSWVLAVNRALTMAIKNGCGPVHINLLVNSYSFTTVSLPEVPRIDYFQTDDLLNEEILSQLKNQINNKRIAILIGSHRKFSCEETKAIEDFVDSYDVAVFYDHTSNYKGKNKVLLSVASGLKRIAIKPEIVIDIGSVTGVYSASALIKDADFWRISEDGEFHQRYGNLKKLFFCSEFLFFTKFASLSGGKSENKYYKAIKEIVGKVVIPDLPFSNIFVSSQMASKLPDNCSFHIGASESLSCMNFFELKDSIDSSCNVGTMGIDGAVSTLVGQSMVNKEKLYFGQFGDLTFFYDMNALGNRHISNNLRILLINNGRGVRFRVTDVIERSFGDEIDEFISAGGHFGSAEGWGRSMGFEYFSASNKTEFLSLIDDFCDPDLRRFDRPVLFEVFTKVEDEQEGLKIFRSINSSAIDMFRVKEIAKQILPQSAVDALKKLKK
jgi:2-succinyl-5-enolpyruvyl-6-hydroxy-3-cyclohexene-1-carboxylate synthase